MTIYAYVTFFAETPLEHIKNQKKKNLNNFNNGMNRRRMRDFSECVGYGKWREHCP